MTVETGELMYGITMYPVVVHIVDPNVIDRTCCKLRIRQYVPRELSNRLGICYACQQFIEAREAARAAIAWDNEMDVCTALPLIQEEATT